MIPCARCNRPHPSGAARRRPTLATVRLVDGTSRTFTAWPVREGWHPAPPCSDSQPVYATPADAALAHARTLGLDAVDAVAESARAAPMETAR